MHHTRRKALLAALVLIPVAYACDEDELTLPSGVEVYTATLTGAAERPNPVSKTLTRDLGGSAGTAQVTVIDNLVSWVVNVVDIDSLTLGHIHRGVADSAGGVMVNLAPAPLNVVNYTGIAAQGSAVVHDSVLTHMRNGAAYINLHTLDNGGGEIRGQLTRVN